MVVTREVVREKLVERKRELAVLLWETLVADETVANFIDREGSTETKHILDRLTDVDEYIRLLDTGELDGSVIR